MESSQVLGDNLRKANLQTRDHDGKGSSTTTHQFEPALAPIGSKAGAPRTSSQLVLADSLPNPPRTSRAPNNQNKSKKKKKTERREETGGPNSLLANTSAQGATSKKEGRSNWIITVIAEDGSRTCTFEGALLTRQPNDVLKLTTGKTTLRGLVRKGGSCLKLKGVEARHFSLFLAALRATRRFDFSPDDLRIILTLASDWGFSKIQSRSMTAIRNTHPTPVEKLLLARRCKLAGWIREAYQTLAIRTPDLHPADASALGPTATSAIARAREEVALHRMQALTLVDPASDDPQCESPSQACREALCEVLPALFANGSKLPKNLGEKQGQLFLKELWWTGVELCDTCKSDAAIDRTVHILEGEIRVARRFFEKEIGGENAKWIQNA